jgi:RND family efflux transporter MFP subunit
MKKLKVLLRGRRLVFVIVAVVLIGIILFLVSRRSASASRFVTATVATGNISKTVSVVGNLQAASQQTGSFSVDSSATVTEIDVHPGDSVKAGQTLAKIDNSNLQNKLIQSQSQLNQAWNNLNNTYVKGHYTSYDILNQKESIRVAQTNYDLAKKDLDSATLKANFDGVVAAVTMTVGNPGGTNSIIVLDPKSLYLDISLSEIDVTTLKKDMTANITFDALNGKNYIGKLAEIAVTPDISSNVVTYKARVSIVASDAQLRSGFSGKSIIVLQSKENVLSVPTAAIHGLNGNTTVTVLKNGVTAQVVVQTGLVADTETEVTSGLAEGDVVVVSVVQTTTGTQGQAAGAFDFTGGGGVVNFRQVGGNGGGATRGTQTTRQN